MAIDLVVKAVLECDAVESEFCRGFLHNEEDGFEGEPFSVPESAERCARDLVEDTESAAVNDGWTQDKNGYWSCPECAKAVELKPSPPG